MLSVIQPLNSSLNLTFLELGQQLHLAGARIFEFEGQGRKSHLWETDVSLSPSGWMWLKSRPGMVAQV